MFDMLSKKDRKFLNGIYFCSVNDYIAVEYAKYYANNPDNAITFEEFYAKYREARHEIIEKDYYHLYGK